MNVKLIKLSLIIFFLTQSFFIQGQIETKQSFDPPTNYYITPTGLASWDTVNEAETDFLHYNIYIDYELAISTDTNFIDLNSEINPYYPLIPNQLYYVDINAEYLTGNSTELLYDLTFTPNDSFPGHNEVYVIENDNEFIFYWNSTESKKKNYEYIGSNIYNNDQLLANIPSDTFYVYQNPPQNYNNYCITKVYTEDGGEHSWDSGHSENCFYIGFTEPCFPPSNLIGYRIGPNQNTGVLHWSPPAMNKDREFQYYNIYREGELLNTSPVLDTFYLDYGVSPYDICYEITAMYSVCGESEPSNVACIMMIWAINELDIKTSIYPNPAVSSIKIESDQQIKNIKLLNELGQTLEISSDIKDKNYRFNISEYENGIYFLEIEYEQGIITRKLVIQK